MQDVFLTSKKTISNVAENTSERMRLTELLQQGEASKLILVRATAGYGKTTMLSHWVKRLDYACVAWLTVVKADNDPIHFWRSLTNSLSTVLTNEMESRLRLLLHSQPSLEILVDSLLNELSFSTEKVQLIIDDYDQIDNSAIHNMMTRFVEFLPSNCAICLSSKTEWSLPVAKWRMKYGLTEIGVEQLRFTYEEAKVFYDGHDVGGGHASALQSLLDMTEGWAAGLRFAYLSMVPSTNNEVTTYQVEKFQSFVREFFLKEVLAFVPPSTREFLVKTSILEQLTPEVCDLLTNRTDSQRFILELERMGLFIIRSNKKDPIFRYHHLLAKTMQSELRSQHSKTAILKIHEQAASVYHKKGDYIFAIKHALSGKAFGLVQEWLRANFLAIISSGQCKTFVRWVRVLMDSEDDVHPEVMIMYAYTMATLQDVEEAYRVILELQSRHEVDQWMNKQEYTTVANDFLSVNAYVLFLKNGDGVKYSEQIKDWLLKRPKTSKWNTIVNRYNQKEPVLFRTNIGSKGKLMADEEAMSFFSFLRTTTYKELSITGYSYGIRAEKLYEWNRIDEVLLELDQALNYGHQFKDPGLLVPMYILKSHIYAAKKQFIVAHTVLNHALEIVDEPHWIDALRIMKAWLYYQAEDVVQAEKELVDSAIQSTLLNSPYRSLMNVRIMLAKGQFENALQLVMHVKMQAQQEGQISTNIEALVLEALCHHELVNDSAALCALHDALLLGESYGYVRTFIVEAKAISLLKKYKKAYLKGVSTEWEKVSLSYVEKLIEKDEDLKQKSVMELLTQREQEVFALLESGASNREIAECLGLTVGTVRVYLSAIYAKLGVSSRTQAILLR